MVPRTFNGKQRVDFFDLEVRYRVVASDRRVVDQDVETAELMHGLVYRPPDGNRIRAIGLDGNAASASTLDRRHDICRAIDAEQLGLFQTSVNR